MHTHFLELNADIVRIHRFELEAKDSNLDLTLNTHGHTSYNRGKAIESSARRVRGAVEPEPLLQCRLQLDKGDGRAWTHSEQAEGP